jgi:spermidine synthase
LIRAYGLLELGIGLYGLIFPLLCLACKPLYAVLYQKLFGSFLAYNTLSAIISMALLFVPTALMGATLPFLSRYWATSPARTGTHIGWLYGVNTIGAALGALVCGFWMVRWLGIYGTVFCAVALNLLIGVVCLAWSRATPGGRGGWPARVGTPPTRRESIADARGIAAIPAASGFSSMAYEVIWTKLISLLVGPTTYSFTVVLFSFITGLALGSLLFGWIADRVRSPFWLLCGSQVGAVVLALGTSQFLGNSQLFFSKVLYTWSDHFALGELAKTGILFAAMLPPTLLLGAVFPLAVKLCAQRTESLGSAVGRLYAMNTAGALLGAFAAGFLLVPLLGQAQSLTLLAAGQTLVCLAVALAHTPRRAGPLALASLAGLGALLLCTQLPRWDMAALATAQYHRLENRAKMYPYISFPDALFHGPAILRREHALQRTLSLEDGLNGFVAVTENVNALGQVDRALSVSGKVDATSRGDLSTEVLLGQLPMLIHSRATQALVIGLASGITAGEMLHYPLERLDVLEISPEVVRACRFFEPWNNRVLSDPRARILVQDARTHLTLSPERYDVIVSEPSNPWMAGVANLFTRGFFLKVRAHLRPGGVFVQWLHTYQSDWDTFATFGRTLRSVFPNALLMRTSRNYTDCVFICFEQPEGFLNLDVATQNLAFAARSSHLRLRAADHLANLVVNEDLGALFGAGPMHTDAHPVLEYLAPRRFNAADTNEIGRILAGRVTLAPRTAQARQAFAAVSRQIDDAEFLSSLLLSPFGIVDLARATTEEKQRYAECLTAYATINEIGIDDLNRLVDPWERKVCLDAQEAGIRAQFAARKAAGDPREVARSFFALGKIFAVRQDYVEAAAWYERAIEQMPDFLTAMQNLQAIYEHLGRHREAAQIVTRFLELGPVTPRLLTDLASNTMKLGDEPKAIRLLERALALDSDYTPALILAAAAYGHRSDLPRAIEYSRRAINAEPQDGRGYGMLAVALVKSGKSQEARDVIAQGLKAVPDDPRLLEMQKQMK